MKKMVNQLVKLFVFINLMFSLTVLGQITINVDDQPYNAVGDGITNDRGAIQSALNDLRDNGGTLRFTSGKTYIIGDGVGNCGLQLYNYSSTHTYHITTTGTEKATIKIADNTPIAWANWGLRIYNSPNITISNIEIDGNRQTRNPEAFGENPVANNYLLQVERKCDGLRLRDLQLENGVVDNLYIFANESDESTFMTDFEMYNCVLENAYRNNMAVIRGKNFKIIGCEFNNALGAEPEAGIDFEPNPTGVDLGYENMLVEGCSFSGNRRFAILLTNRTDDCGNSIIKNNYFHNNGMQIASKNNIVRNNIFRRMNHAPILGSGANEETRDGIIYFHTGLTSEDNEIVNNYFYDNNISSEEPYDKHLIAFMWNSGFPNDVNHNYSCNNQIAGIVSVVNPSRPQNVSDNEMLNRKEMGFWTMDANSISDNSVTDFSYFNQTSTMLGNPEVVTGYRNEALNFAPDNKYVEVTAKDNLDIEMNITLSAWIKWNGSNPENQAIIIGRGNNWRFGLSNSTGQLGFHAFSTHGYTAGWLRVSDPIQANIWTHVALTYNGSTTKLYINGEEKAIEQANGSIGTSHSTISIGSYSGTTYSFNGSIDEVKIFNYGLSSAEVNYIYEHTGSTLPSSITASIEATSDDAEEIANNGNVELTSSDLNLGTKRVGLRFNNITIPQGATITNAYLQFSADEHETGNVSLRIRGNDVDNATTFTLDNGNVYTNRAKTTSYVIWTPGNWTLGNSGAAQRTSDISSVVQEIVDRGGWASGNSMAFLITSTIGYNGNERAADAFADFASELFIEYSTNSAQKGVINSEEIIPQMYSLVNYPNPFNPTTNIQFNLPKDGNVKIVVYDILGRVVSELVDGNFKSGSHNVVWNAQSLTSGIYIATIHADSFSKSIKMLLMK